MFIKPPFKPIDIFITDLAEAKAKELVEANVLPSAPSYATTPIASVEAKRLTTDGKTKKNKPV